MAARRAGGERDVRGSEHSQKDMRRAHPSKSDTAQLAGEPLGRNFYAFRADPLRPLRVINSLIPTADICT
jgi:hypothetical protein